MNNRTILDEGSVKILNNIRGILSESTLNRIEKWVKSKDIAGISAFRGRLTNFTNNTLMDIEPETEYSKKENLKRNILLKSALLKSGYGITRVAGSYLEKGSVESQEESFIVVNLNNDPEFRHKIFKLSEYFNQDSFLYKHKDSDDAFLIGTNYDDYVGYKNIKHAGTFYKNVTAQFMSRLGAQGFAFSNEDNPILPDKPYTFDDRKNDRSPAKPEEVKDLTKPEKSEELKEYREIFKLETFEKLQNSTKWLCSSSAKPIMEVLNL
jgi:hypothetical protein